MNREILFRGKRKSNEHWIYGYVNADNRGVTIKFIENNFYKEIPVIPETVGQYIGLTDKNGKKIFEGDILKGYIYPFYASDDDTFNYYAVVVWFEEICSYRLVTIKAPDSSRRGISAGNDDSFEDFQSEDWKIIGNVHDNPELLPDWILSWL